MCTAVPVRLISIFTRLMCSVDDAITAEGDDSGYARAFIGADGALRLTIRTEHVFLFGVVARFDPGPNIPIAATSTFAGVGTSISVDEVAIVALLVQTPENAVAATSAHAGI